MRQPDKVVLMYRWLARFTMQRMDGVQSMPLS